MLFSNTDLVGGFFLLSWFGFASAKPTACVTNDQNDENCHDGVQEAFILEHPALPYLAGVFSVQPLSNKLERCGWKARLEGSCYVNFWPCPSGNALPRHADNASESDPFG